MWYFGMSIWFWSDIPSKPIWDNHNISLGFFAAVLSSMHSKRCKVIPQLRRVLPSGSDSVTSFYWSWIQWYSLGDVAQPRNLNFQSKPIRYTYIYICVFFFLFYIFFWSITTELLQAKNASFFFFLNIIRFSFFVFYGGCGNSSQLLSSWNQSSLCSEKNNLPCLSCISLRVIFIGWPALLWETISILFFRHLHQSAWIWSCIPLVLRETKRKIRFITFYLGHRSEACKWTTQSP